MAPSRCSSRPDALSLTICFLLPFLTRAATPPAELYSPLIGQKVLTIASNESVGLYPEYTDRTQGIWKYFDPNTWTTGFFPATLYALNTRSQLCSAVENGTDWLSLGRQWSTGEIPFEINNTLMHDVGFVSFPFQEELLVCVASRMSSMHSSRDAFCTETPKTKPRSLLSITSRRTWPLATAPSSGALVVGIPPIRQTFRYVTYLSSRQTKHEHLIQVIIDNMMNLEVCRMGRISASCYFTNFTRRSSSRQPTLLAMTLSGRSPSTMQTIP